MENDGPNQGEDDAAAFRRLQSRRKAKALEFLKDKFSTFNLLLTVSLANGTARITNFCFELVNADKAELVQRQGERSAARMRTRVRSKGPDAFRDFGEHQSRLHMHGVQARCQSFVNASWTQLQSDSRESTTAAIPSAFWPRDEPVTLRHKMVTEDVLRNIAAIKWRMLDKFAAPPWSFSHLVLPNVDAEDWSKSLQSFLEVSPCCLDAGWSRPLQQHLKGLDPADRNVFFQRAVARFYGCLRPVSLREEQSHAVQRKLAGGTHATALTSNIQRAASVVQTVKKNFEVRGGRNLDFAPPKVIKAFKQSKKKGHFCRPNQMGNVMFFYIAQKRKQGDTRSKSTLCHEWKGLPPNIHQWWRAKYRTHLSIKRTQESDAKAFAAAQDPGGLSTSTSWGIGNADFPIHPDSFRPFLRKHQGKRSGLEALKTVVDTSNPRPPEIEEYINDVTSGAKPYHIKTALGLICNHALGPALDGEKIRNCELAREIMATEKLSNACLGDHVGLCKTAHAQELNGIREFLKAIPRKSCLLRFKVGRLVLHARAVLGQAFQKIVIIH